MCGGTSCPPARGVPRSPPVVVNQYYDPFGRNTRCLRSVGLTSGTVRILVQRLDALNAVLSEGAKASGFRSCSPTSQATSSAMHSPTCRGPLTARRSIRPRSASSPSSSPTSVRSALRHQRSEARTPPAMVCRTVFFAVDPERSRLALAAQAWGAPVRGTRSPAASERSAAWYSARSLCQRTRAPSTPRRP